MAQKTSAHPRFVVGECTLGGGTGVVVVLVPDMPAKAFVDLALVTAGAAQSGTRYAVDNSVAGQFTVQAYSSAHPVATVATDISKHNFCVFMDPVQT